MSITNFKKVLFEKWVKIGIKILNNISLEHAFGNLRFITFKDFCRMVCGTYDERKKD